MGIKLKNTRLVGEKFSNIKETSLQFVESVGKNNMYNYLSIQPSSVEECDSISIYKQIMNFIDKIQDKVVFRINGIEWIVDKNTSFESYKQIGEMAFKAKQRNLKNLSHLGKTKLKLEKSFFVGDKVSDIEGTELMVVESVGKNNSYKYLESQPTSIGSWEEPKVYEGVIKVVKEIGSQKFDRNGARWTVYPSDTYKDFLQKGDAAFNEGRGKLN